MSGIAASGYREHHFKSHDGLSLYARDYGGDRLQTEGRLPLVCLAGLTRNTRDFHRMALVLSNHPQTPRRVIAIDMRGRGQSEWDQDKSHYNIVVEASDAISGCEALGIEKAAFIGTSRGGLILHMLIGMKPELLGPLIMNDVGPALGVDGLRLIQSYLGRRGKFRSIDEAAAAMKLVHRAAFPALSPADWLDYAETTFREVDGGFESDCDPAIAEAMAAIDLTQPLPDLWEQFDALKGLPLLTIRAENSLLLTPEILEAMKQRHPQMQTLIAKGQGHAPILHLDGITDGIAEFLKDY